MLQAIQVECTRGNRVLFNALTFELGSGGLLQVVGANGSGKTSLLRIVCGLLEPRAGEVCWNGSNIRALAEDYRRELVYIGHATGLKEDLTPAENLRIACILSGMTREADALDVALRAFGLERYRYAPIKTLSQGQRRRAALARLLLADAHPLWLLDEPFNALDESAASHLQHLINAHLARGGMVMLASHAPLAALRNCGATLELGRAAL